MDGQYLGPLKQNGVSFSDGAGEAIAVGPALPGRKWTSV